MDTSTGKTLYRINVTEDRRAVLWVLADDVEAAKEDAEILAHEIGDNEWDDYETDWDCREATSPPKNPRAKVWTGGPDGDEVTWDSIA